MRALPLLAVIAVTACAGPPAPPPAPPGPPPGVEGRYRGTARLVHGPNRFCPRSGPRTYEVAGKSVTFSYQERERRRKPLTADVGPDGRFRASDGEGTLEGQLAGGTLEFTVASKECEHRWTMRKIP